MSIGIPNTDRSIYTGGNLADVAVSRVHTLWHHASMLESYNTRCSYVENLFTNILLTLLIVPNDNILASPLMYIKWMELPILNTKAEQRQPTTPTYLGGHPHALYIVSIGFKVLSNPTAIPTRHPKGHCELFFSKIRTTKPVNSTAVSYFSECGFNRYLIIGELVK